MQWTLASFFGVLIVFILFLLTIFAFTLIKSKRERNSRNIKITTVQENVCEAASLYIKDCEGALPGSSHDFETDITVSPVFISTGEERGYININVFKLVYISYFYIDYEKPKEMWPKPV